MDDKKVVAGMGFMLDRARGWWEVVYPGGRRRSASDVEVALWCDLREKGVVSAAGEAGPSLGDDPPSLDADGFENGGDKNALAILPKKGWFRSQVQPISNPLYRCERLCRAGLLEREEQRYPGQDLRYRRVPESDGKST